MSHGSGTPQAEVPPCVLTGPGGDYQQPWPPSTAGARKKNPELNAPLAADDLKVAGVTDSASRREAATQDGQGLLLDAFKLVGGARQSSYGHPLDDFARTAALWNALLGSRLKAPLTAADVPLLMIAVKLAREAHTHTRDNLVDIAGYVACLEMVQSEQGPGTGDQGPVNSAATAGHARN